MTALEHLVHQLEEKASFLKDGISLGRAASFEEYKGTCGKIQGLLEARDLIKDLMQNMETSDD